LLPVGGAVIGEGDGSLRCDREGHVVTGVRGRGGGPCRGDVWAGGQGWADSLTAQARHHARAIRLIGDNIRPYELC
jgi:hypothetical protein